MTVVPLRSLTTAPLLTMSVTGRRSRSTIGRGEVKAAARDERDGDAARRRLGQRLVMRIRQTPAAVEQRAIDVDGEQADHRVSGPGLSPAPRWPAISRASDSGATTFAKGPKLRIQLFSA